MFRCFIGSHTVHFLQLGKLQESRILRLSPKPLEQESNHLQLGKRKYRYMDAPYVRDS